MNKYAILSFKKLLLSLEMCNHTDVRQEYFSEPENGNFALNIYD